MNSVTTEKFRKSYENLPLHVQQVARDAFHQWKEDSFHPGLHFKLVHSRKSIYSVRIGLSWRALGIKEGETMIWFWIGSHADYDKILSTL
jgi:mRNA-degrading endonuclease RelE of RelBE toxin-antitoxin system